MYIYINEIALIIYLHLGQIICKCHERGNQPTTKPSTRKKKLNQENMLVVFCWVVNVTKLIFGVLRCLFLNYVYILNQCCHLAIKSKRNLLEL